MPEITGAETDSTTDLATVDLDLTAAEIAHLIDGSSIDDLVTAANGAGKTEFKQLAAPALAELLRRTEGDPKALIRAGHGDLSKLVAGLLIDQRFKNLPAHSKATAAQHKLLRESLEGPSPTAIESMLAARAAVDWLALHVHELTFSMDRQKHSMQGEAHMERVRDRLHRRYLNSLKALATVRRLNIPGSTVIVGGVQQVIVGQPEKAS